MLEEISRLLSKGIGRIRFLLLQTTALMLADVALQAHRGFKQQTPLDRRSWQSDLPWLNRTSVDF